MMDPNATSMMTSAAVTFRTISAPPRWGDWK